VTEAFQGIPMGSRDNAVTSARVPSSSAAPTGHEGHAGHTGHLSEWLRRAGGPIRAAIRRRLLPYAVAALGVAGVSLVIGAVVSQARIDNISMLYLLVVLGTAIRFGHGPAIFASLAAFLAFDWFFIDPLHTFTVADPEEWVALLLFLIVAVVAGSLAAAERRRADEAQRREREAVALHALSRILNASDELDATLRAVTGHLHAELRLTGCAVLLPEYGTQGGRAIVQAAAGERPSAKELAAAPWLAMASASRDAQDGLDGPHRWVRIRPEHGPLGRRPAHRVEFVPIAAGTQTVGMLRLAREPSRPTWTPEEARLLGAAAEQIGRMVERTRLRRMATDAEVLRKTEDVRQALLASVSHDLRTPLASIQASAESLAQTEIAWSDEERHGFATAIVQETGRMGRLIDNLLDMSRIEAGKLRPDRDWYPLDALVDDVLGRLESITAGHEVVVDVPETLPPAPLDYVQIGEALANLVENAVKYTPPGSAMRITAGVEGERLRVAVEDDGPGIPAEALPHVFEKFYRVSGVAGGDRSRTKGTGLGLAVARGFVEAHGGTIEAQSPPPGQPHGTRFVFWLPLQAPDQRPGAASVQGAGPAAATLPGAAIVEVAR
jgi:two-component system sensor histidine kinase KdpD